MLSYTSKKKYHGYLEDDVLTRKSKPYGILIPSNAPSYVENRISLENSGKFCIELRFPGLPNMI